MLINDHENTNFSDESHVRGKERQDCCRQLGHILGNLQHH